MSYDDCSNDPNSGEDSCFNNDLIVRFDDLTTAFDQMSSNFSNINIYDSKNVHIGNQTDVHGTIYINQFSTDVTKRLEPPQLEVFSIVPRRSWLAQPPASDCDILYFEQVPKCVIISHTASEESLTQPANNLNVRLIQQFHIESRQWNDIGYNFLIGADGSVYEGRGWDVVGSHAYQYNRFSLGISFIGCYVSKLPPLVAIKKAKDLIQHGIKLGKIEQVYRLLGHCQCSNTSSPGQKLYEEIQTWDNWDSTISFDNPIDLIERNTL